jgi:hypothetical protein
LAISVLLRYYEAGSHESLIGKDESVGALPTADARKFVALGGERRGGDAHAIAAGAGERWVSVIFGGGGPEPT